MKPVVERCGTMPSELNAQLRSIRRWLLIAVFMLGIVVITLADIAYTVSDYEGGGLAAAVGIIGGSIALGAGVKLLGSFSTPD